MTFFHQGAAEFEVHSAAKVQGQRDDVTAPSPANYDSRCQILQITCDLAVLAFFFFLFFLIALFKARKHNEGLSTMSPCDKCEPRYKGKQLGPC